MAAWVVPKEFVFDIRVEHQTIADGIKDAASYVIGASIAIIVLLIAHR